MDEYTDNFLDMLNEPPSLHKYQKELLSYEKKVMDEWNEKIYGGSILNPTRVQYSTRLIVNPLSSIIQN